MNYENLKEILRLGLMENKDQKLRLELVNGLIILVDIYQNAENYTGIKPISFFLKLLL